MIKTKVAKIYEAILDGTENIENIFIENIEKGSLIEKHRG